MVSGWVSKEQGKSAMKPKPLANSSRFLCSWLLLPNRWPVARLLAGPRAEARREWQVVGFGSLLQSEFLESDEELSDGTPTRLDKGRAFQSVATHTSPSI